MGDKRYEHSGHNVYDTSLEHVEEKRLYTAVKNRKGNQTVLQ